MKPWYEELFTDYAETYDKEVFTQGTLGECDFIEKEIGGDRSIRILDIGCGTGRHGIELARRGYRVTGVDLSADQIAKARKKARAAGVEADFRVADARSLTFDKEFDLVQIICEGAFPLMGTDEENFAILEGAARAVKPGGKLILTTLNVLFPLAHSVKDFEAENLVEGMSDDHAFDPKTFRMKSTFQVRDDHGREKTLSCDERYYAPSEITWLLKRLGFTAISISGSKIGAFNRADSLTPDDFEMLVVAEMRR
ncbi:MAG: class I SAM-dependent methyltransferase [Candidatus Aminicenantes bacterium]|nr:class I SAM-dependent methyltransferase [Candidatus Aminicenantes bacterium]